MELLIINIIWAALFFIMDRSHRNDISVLEKEIAKLERMLYARIKEEEQRLNENQLTIA